LNQAFVEIATFFANKVVLASSPIFDCTKRRRQGLDDTGRFHVAADLYILRTLRLTSFECCDLAWDYLSARIVPQSHKAIPNVG